MKQEIVSREKLAVGAGRTVRFATLRMLKCGHEQVEPKGGKAKDAKFAQCEKCDTIKELSTVLKDFKPHPPEPVEGD